MIRPRSSPATQPAQQQHAQVSREQLIDLLNADLAREYQAIISYIIYSQRIKGPQYVAVADDLEQEATEELGHALKLSKQIDYLGGTAVTQPEHVEVPEDAEAMLRLNLEAERETIRQYRQRVHQAEALGELAIAQMLREILVQEQEHLITLSSALNIEVPEV